LVSTATNDGRNKRIKRIESPFGSLLFLEKNNPRAEKAIKEYFEISCGATDFDILKYNSKTPMNAMYKWASPFLFLFLKTSTNPTMKMR
jgi:hypothetical protein